MANLCPFLSLLLQFFFLGCCTISSYIGILVYAICWLLHLWILFMCNTHCLFVQTLRQSGDFNDHICSLSGDLYAMVPAEHLLIGFSCKFSTENCCNVWMRWLSIQLYNRLNAHDCVCSWCFRTCRNQCSFWNSFWLLFLLNLINFYNIRRLSTPLLRKI